MSAADSTDPFSRRDSESQGSELDAVALETLRHLLESIPEEMGSVLRMASSSPNIKERLDFSCAITGPGGALAAQASHIPVHLGSVQMTGEAVLSTCQLQQGDVIIVNDPWQGGTHLPDITLFAPVFLEEGAPATVSDEGLATPPLGVICRAHHADVGGMVPGSMSADARSVFAEGLVLPPVHLLRGGRLVEDVRRIILANTRTPEERREDLDAQLAAMRRGVSRLQALGAAMPNLIEALAALRQRARRATSELLSTLPARRVCAQTPLAEAGGPSIAVALERKADQKGGEALLRVDFSGTSAALDRPLNGNRAIALSAVFYVLRLFLGRDVPTNAGCLDGVHVEVPPGSLLDPPRGYPVAGGNVETSQRVVDALMLALAKAWPERVPACSQGTMNNLAVGGRDGQGRAFTFYETLGGGAGGGPRGRGASGLQVHMTNTRNTPIEALEAEYPVRVTAYHLRRGSGGAGQHSGGEGLVREVEALVPMDVNVMGTRRDAGPPGAAGGSSGAAGRDRLLRMAAGDRPRTEEVATARAVRLQAGDRVRIETPGGGAYGTEA